MKHLFFLLSFLTLSFFGRTQMTSSASVREGLYGGLSVGYFHYKTSWYYHRADGNPAHDNYPVHSLNRAVVSLNLEKKSLREVHNIHFDLGGELLFGPTGKAKGTWLPDDDVISSGGWSAGLNAYVRAVYVPVAETKGLHLFPFLSLGPQYMFLHNNGKGTGPYASEAVYDYKEGWNEGVVLLAGSVGVDLQSGSFVLTPEIRFGLFGWSSSSWEPGGGGATMDGGPGFTAFSVRVAKKF